MFVADETILRGFEDILGCSLPPAQRAQVSLPLSTGGCGLRCPMQVRTAARIAALFTFLTEGASRVGLPEFAQQRALAWLSPVLTKLGARLGKHDTVVSWAGDHQRVLQADPECARQKWWTAALGRKRMEELVAVVPPRDQARILEQQKGVGSAFMSVPPSIPLRTFLSPEQYRLGLRWWLGLPLVPEDETPLSCPGCGAEADRFGDHVLCCRENNYHRRHDAVVEALNNALIISGQGVQKEVRVPGTEEDPNLRPADLLLSSWQGGKDTAVDVTVRHAWSKAERTPAKDSAPSTRTPEGLFEAPGGIQAPQVR